MLNSKQIEVFYTVYKEGSLTRAARSLNVSQPSISNSLSYSEQKLNLKLFLRQGRRLIPTPEADILYKRAQVVNQHISQFNNVSRNLLSDQLGYIDVGCTPSLGLRLMPQLINAYLQQEPEALFNIVNLQSAELENQLLELTFDIVICFNPEGSEVIHKQILKKGQMRLMTPPDFHSNKTQLDIRDLSDSPFIRIKNLKPTDAHDSLESYLQRNGLKLKWVVQTETIEVAKSLVAEGIGFALIDDFSVSPSNLPANVGLYSLVPKITYEIGVLRNLEKPMSLSAAKFVRFVEGLNESDLEAL
jgi:DNA-binding transcriptional LysR family regulator